MMKIAGITKLCTRLSGIAIAMAALSYTPVLLAQNVTGSISGTVADSSGAVIPGAHVIAENVNTAVKTEATTNSAGTYTIRFLPIGNYRVVVDAKGFSTQTVPPFTLEIAQTVKVNATLIVGSSTTSVEVQSDATPILDTNDASLGITLSTNEIGNVPLNGRNFSSLTLFQPGAVSTSPQGLSSNNAIERDTFNDGQASIDGNRDQANNYTLEGIDMNEPQNNLIGYNPAPDALGQVRVVAANADASYGNANGGAVVTLLKSGTNQYHGSAYFFLENQNLDANTWAHNHTIPITPISPYTQTIFGGTFGGPILRDKLFFFLDYEGARQHTGGISSLSVLDQKMRNGDFSELSTQLYNTQAGFTQFANNQVPIVNPVAKFLFAHPELYPLPNATATDGLLANNYQGFQRQFHLNNQGDIKIDYNLRARDKFTAFYAQSDAGDLTTALIPVEFPGPNTFPTKLGGGSWVHTFSSAIVNEARIGFTRVRWDTGVPSDPSGVFGLSGNAKVGIAFVNQSYDGFTDQNMSNGSTVSDFGTTANPQEFRDNTFTYEDRLTWQHGRSLFSIGAQAQRYQQNYVNSDNFGFLGKQIYSGVFTSNSSVSSNSGGYAPADFVLDLVDETQIASPLGRIGQRQWRIAGYFQDDFKATSRLTINLGLRYEYDQPWYEQNNKTANVLLATGTVEYAGSLPVGAVPGSIVCPTRACYNATYDQFMPRLGFAFQATPRFVLRGGYGASSFFEGYSFNQRLTTSPPFASGADVKATSPTPPSGGLKGNPGTPFPAESGLSETLNSSSGYSVWPQNNQPAYIHQFNLTTEYALTNTLSLSVGYLGEIGQHLADYRNGNQLTLAQGLIISNLPSGAPIPAAATAPYASLVGQSGGLLITESAAMMNYNGGQVTLRQRTNHGLEFTLNYTYSKSLTNAAGDYGQAGINSLGSDLSFQNGYNSSADYGPAGSDVRHNFNALGVYAVPFGRGKAYGGNINRALDLIAGGWKISGSAIVYSGFPITINSTDNSNTNSYGSARANHYRKLIVRNRSVDHWWGTDPSATPCSGPDNGVCAYGIELPNTFGTASINSERTPGYKQIDASMFKDFHLFAEHVIGFRADFFNAFNIVSYQNPDNNVQDPNFGNISNQGTPVRSPARQIQLSLHYNF